MDTSQPTLSQNSQRASEDRTFIQTKYRVMVLWRPVLGKVTFKSNALQYCVTP